MTWKQRPLLLVIAALLAPMSGEVRAQGVDVDLTLNQSFTSVETLPSPTGFRLGVNEPARWGRFGSGLDSATCGRVAVRFRATAA